jgi:Ca2+-transporting ATPase
MTIALAQIFHLANARSKEHILMPRRLFSNYYAIGAVILTVALQILAIHLPPLARALGLRPLTPYDWVIVVGLALVPAAIGQLLKLIRRYAPAESRPRRLLL